MKIAVTYEDGQVFQHFGHTEQFKVYTVEDGKVVTAEVLKTEGSGHSALAELLQAWDISVLICGGIGGCAQTALKEAGIKYYGGVTGDADAQVDAYLLGTLEYDPEAQCTSHEHDGEHSCGGH